jgi:hypothetical protein
MLKSVTTWEQIHWSVREEVLEETSTLDYEEESRVWRSRQGRATAWVIYRNKVTFSDGRPGLVPIFFCPFGHEAMELGLLAHRIRGMSALARPDWVKSDSGGELGGPVVPKGVESSKVPLT